MTSFELRELLVGHLCLRGNAYCFIEREDGEVVALWPLHPDKVTVEVQAGSLSTSIRTTARRRSTPWQDILHIRGCLPMESSDIRR